jgi:hypothetical protein
MREVTRGKMGIEAKEERGDDFEFVDYFVSLCVYEAIKTTDYESLIAGQS